MDKTTEQQNKDQENITANGDHRDNTVPSDNADDKETQSTAGEIEEIRDYCETDVINTYLVYLRYQHHRGTLSTSNLNIALEDLLSLLQEKGSEKKSYQDFLEAWTESSGGDFFLK